MVIAGEVSGDMRAAELIEAANVMVPGLTWFGIGGPQMRAAGVDTRYDIKDMAVIGFAEVVRRYPFFKRVFNEMLVWADQEKPDLVLFVDYPGFNLRLASRLHARGFQTLFYICPQVWAWHRSRIPKMAGYLDHLISIFPFEAEHFEGTGLPVTYVGHPLVDRIQAALSAEPTPLPWSGLQRVALLPGSRTAEIKRLLPIMLDAAAILKERQPGVCYIAATPGEAQAELARTICRSHKLSDVVTVLPDMTYEVVRQADAAMVCSGTATLETALLGCPMAVVYKLSPVSYLLFRALVRIPDIGMVNVVAGRRICPELVQGQATPENMADAIEPILTQTPSRVEMLEALRRLQEKMGEGGAAKRAASILTGMLAPPSAC